MLIAVALSVFLPEEKPPEGLPVIRPHETVARKDLQRLQIFEKMQPATEC